MKKCLVLLLIFTVSECFSQAVPKTLIQNYLGETAKRSGYKQTDINSWKVESTGFSKTTGIENYYIKQLFSGIEIEGTTTNILVKNGSVLPSEIRFETNLYNRIQIVKPGLNAEEALAVVLRELQIPVSDYRLIQNQANTFEFRSETHRDNPIAVKQVYFTAPDQSIRLTWNFNFYTPDFRHLWNVYADVENGKIIDKSDWVVHCNFGPLKKTSVFGLHFAEKIFRNQSAGMNGVVGSYRVFPYYIESPNHGSRELVATRGDVIASPYGWHDTDGLDGAEFTITRGNNVWAKEDTDADNAGGLSPDGGTALIFDFPYGGTETQSDSYTSAATTNLFYMGNVMHDIFYRYGFDEVNGNFQHNNYGKGGRSGDVVLAESQDASMTNNATFSTPADGQSPRMQMFLWNNPPLKNLITVTSPDALAGSYAASDNSFSAGHVPLPFAPDGITANLVLFDDGISDTADACSPALDASTLTGKIALIRRGNCLFTDKAIAAQNAGAVAVIVINTSDARVTMSGDNSNITIPVISVSKTYGEALAAALAMGSVTVTLADQPDNFVIADSDFDNGVIAHEYTHGISTRLTGGANSSNCLLGSEQMGEGWSDFMALMLQMKPTDTGSHKKGIATFLNGEAIDGHGIRNYPYSTDMAINPLTFGATNGMTVQEDGETKINTHAVGTVWASMLWDLAWAYVEKYGFDPDVYSGSGGNNKVMQLVVDAMKIQPCNPTFVQARNAILLADRQTTGGQDYCMIWAVFARRGLGVHAASGGNSGIAGINDQIEDFTIPDPDANCDIFANLNTIILYPNPVDDVVKVTAYNYTGPMLLSVFDIRGRLVKKLGEPNFSREMTLPVPELQKGVYFVRIEGSQIAVTRKIIKQ